MPVLQLLRNEYIWCKLEFFSHRPIR